MTSASRIGRLLPKMALIPLTWQPGCSVEESNLRLGEDEYLNQGLDALPHDPDLSDQTGEGLELIGGRPANPADFPASVWTRTCSATVVGPRSVFIAAHCVTGGYQISFNVGASNYNAACHIAREYANGNSTTDYALCLTDRVVEGIPYEHINTDPQRVSVGDSILLTGYGCTQRNGQGSGGNDGTYRIGESKVVRLPRNSDADIVASSGATVCPGDSGGPAFWIDQQSGMRWVVSTNSRVSMPDMRTSYLSSTTHPEGLRFFKAWTELTSQKICGMHNDTPNCRDGKGGKGGGGSNPSPKFSLRYPFVDIEATMQPGHEHRIEEVREGIEDLLEGF